MNLPSLIFLNHYQPIAETKQYNIFLRVVILIISVLLVKLNGGSHMRLVMTSIKIMPADMTYWAC